MDGRIEIDEEWTDGIEPEQDDVPVSDEQRNELDRRLKAYALDGNRGRLASKIVAEIRRRRAPL
jgi:putative addiction module component (TIGR02574 family)